ncbi:MAG: ABC transporter permease [Dehalococcoidia bacterium]|jgi:molybdate transport system permease protein|nr:ABC transporter permease [Dehalococcoidia bacterium]GIS82796.1 MAG: molybdenum ABC transporter permease [Dehalococcoidia bacterium]
MIRTFAGIKTEGRSSHPLWMPAGITVTLLYVLFIGLPVVAILVKAAQQKGLMASLLSDTTIQALQLSIVTSIISIIIVVIIGTPFALLLARKDNLLLKFIDSLVELPIILPPIVAGVAMLMAFGRQGIMGPALSSVGIALPFTTGAVICAQIFVAAPFYIRAAKLGFQSVSTDYEDVSQTLGVSPWQTFWKLTIPLASPSILSGLALAWARAISEFGATIMFAGNLTGKTQTMPLAILTAMESDIGASLGLSVILLFASIIVLIILGFFANKSWRANL